MVSRINSHFRYAHEKLQDASIRSLGLIDQMIIDFKMDPPDTDLLKEILGTISGSKCMAPSSPCRMKVGKGGNSVTIIDRM